jgi:hypothetical protein
VTLPKVPIPEQVSALARLRSPGGIPAHKTSSHRAHAVGLRRGRAA